MTDVEPANKQRMRAYLDRWNDHDVEAIIEFFAEDVDGFTPDRRREICNRWFTAFPDLHHDVRELAGDGDWVLGRVTLTGTHEGAYRGIPPTGNEIEVDDHFSTRFEDGMIVEHHATADSYTLLRQLGVTLPPERTREEANKGVVRRYFSALNERDEEAFIDTMADDSRDGSIAGPEEMAENEWEWIEALDIEWDIRSMFADGDYVITDVAARGTHSGTFKGIDPTGESFEVTATTISRIEDGRIVEWRAERDLLTLAMQLGVIESPFEVNP